MNKLFKYFFSGLLTLIPVIILYQIAKSISVLWRGVFVDFGFLATFIISFIIISFLGFLVSAGIGEFFRKKFVKYSKNRGVFSFISELILNFKSFSENTKKAFQNPVYFEVSEGIHKLGFITDDSLDFLSQKELKDKKIAVYSPDPISFMGELLFIDKKAIKIIDEKDKENIPVFLYTAGIIKKMK